VCDRNSELIINKILKCFTISAAPCIVNILISGCCSGVNDTIALPGSYAWIDSVYRRFFATYGSHLHGSTRFIELLDRWNWDRYVLPKRR